MGTGVTLEQAHKHKRQLFASDRWNNVAIAGKQTVIEIQQLIKYKQMCSRKLQDTGSNMLPLWKIKNKS